jgi:hypothetical protein
MAEGFLGDVYRHVLELLLEWNVAHIKETGQNVNFRAVRPESALAVG